MNMKSYTCWHVYGLIYRSEHKYGDAIKCYQNALKIDPKNLQILKDMALLQVQRRYLAQYEDTCRRILLIKSNHKPNWLALAVAMHLNGRPNDAFGVLTSYLTTLSEEQKKLQCVDNNEIHMYRADLLREAGKYDEAIKYINDHSKDPETSVLSDRATALEILADCHVRKGELEQAQHHYRQLLDMNPDNVEYHTGLVRAMGIALPGDDHQQQQGDDAKAEEEDEERKSAVSTPPGPTDSVHFATSLYRVKLIAPVAYPVDELTKLKQLYAELGEKYPKCHAVKRIPLNFLSGDSAEFREALDQYVRAPLRKGVPSLFRDLTSLYGDASKVRVIEELMLGYREQLLADGRFSASDKVGEESPVAYVWVLFFLAHHYDALNQMDKAFEAVNTAIAHTPTVIDLYMLKARLYKHCGDAHKAYEFMDHARELDLADRYLNTKCVRYAFRAGQIKKAEKTLRLFLRESEGVTGVTDLTVMWYELGLAEALMEQQCYGFALKMLHTVDKHYTDIYEDHFDFHNYCLRRSMLRAYVSAIGWENHIRSHRYYYRAARGLVKMYVDMFDRQQAGETYEPGTAEEKARIVLAEINVSKSGEGQEEEKKENNHEETSEQQQTDDEQKAEQQPKQSGDKNDGEDEELKNAANAQERKRILKRRKRQAAKAAKKRAKELEAQKANKSKQKQEDDKSKEQQKQVPNAVKTSPNPYFREKEEDPFGEELMKTTTPLDRASQYVQELQRALPKQLETQVMACDVYVRKRKFVLVAQAIRRAAQINADSPELHTRVVDFILAFQKHGGDAHEAVAQAVRAALTDGTLPLQGDLSDATAYNNAWIEAHKGVSHAHRLAGARALIAIDAASNKARAVALAADLSDAADAQPCNKRTFAVAVEALRFLEAHDAGAVDAFKSAAHTKFPRTPAFMSAEQLAARADDVPSKNTAVPTTTSSQ
eukprot:TRINITY_DN66257_c12_g1_i1.p1 TRINITY_DN66257_c12_g1~~TRINITY_DN66257_c12_g1_i1.p1  ORF type:complete len:1066 (-),score=592.35 TRINITY_DN66257_c12_g1_i1:53-2875(-)